MESASKGVEGRKSGDKVRVLWVQGRVVQEGALFDRPRGAWSCHVCFLLLVAASECETRAKKVGPKKSASSLQHPNAGPPRKFRRIFVTASSHAAGTLGRIEKVPRLREQETPARRLRRLPFPPPPTTPPRASCTGTNNLSMHTTSLHHEPSFSPVPPQVLLEDLTLVIDVALLVAFATAIHLLRQKLITVATLTHALSVAFLVFTVGHYIEQHVIGMDGVEDLLVSRRGPRRGGRGRWWLNSWPTAGLLSIGAIMTLGKCMLGAERIGYICMSVKFQISSNDRV